MINIQKYKNLLLDVTKYITENSSIINYEYEIDEENYDVLTRIFINACDYESNEEVRPEYLDIYQKGILLFGSVGSGKSDAMKIAQVYRGMNPKCKKLKSIHTKDIVSDYAIIGEKSFDFYKKDDYVFDEIGAVNETSKNYGNSSNVISEIIMFRYDLWKNSGVRSYFTTNLTITELSQKYGDRIFSRLAEMCNFYQLSSREDRRFLPKKHKPVITKIDDEDAIFVRSKTKFIEDGFSYSQKAKNEILEILRNIYKKYNQSNELHTNFKKNVQKLAEMIKNVPELSEDENLEFVSENQMQNFLNFKFKKSK